MSILLFFVILIILIVVHELGHFSIAKLFGIRVDEFGLGFPPKIFGIKKGETEYTLNWIPFGGFVRIFGENPDEESISGADSSRSMVNKPKWVQVAVLVAGVTFNFIFAWLLISITFMSGVEGSASRYNATIVHDAAVTITGVVEDSPAHTAGVMVGDEIVSLSAQGEKVTITDVAGAQNFIFNHGTTSITMTLDRDGKILTASAVPVFGLVEGKPALGISMDVIGTIKLWPHIAVWEGLKTTVQLTGAIAGGLLDFLKNVFLFKAQLSQVTGPVGIVGMVGDASALGLMYLLTFTAFISLNLAVINLLPFPALDGGRILFVIIEKIKGSAIKPTVANMLNTIGFVLLIILMLVVTAHDILKLF